MTTSIKTCFKCKEPDVKPCPICGLYECEHEGDTDEQ
jgi:hypothetical protein